MRAARSPANAAIRAFDLANEIDDAQRPPIAGSGKRVGVDAREHDSRESLRMPRSGSARTCRRSRPTTTCASTISPALLDEDVMHAYPLYSDFARSFLDPELVPFSCALTAGLSGAGRPTLMQEFGMCTAPPGVGGPHDHRRFSG